MGTCWSAERIFHIGKAIINEFDGLNTFGQVVGALTAKDRNACPISSSCDSLEDTMRCQFMAGQRRPWEIAVWSWILTLILLGIFIGTAWKNAKKKARTVQAMLQNVTNNKVEVSLAKLESGSELQTTSRRASRNDSACIDMPGDEAGQSSLWQN